MTKTKTSTIKPNFVPGLNSLPEDSRDLVFGRAFWQPKKAALVDQTYRIFEPFKIRDQRQTDFCGAFTGAYLQDAQEGVAMEPAFIFAIVKKLLNDPKGYGMDLRTLMKALVKVGSLPEELSPYSLANKSPDFLRDWKNWPLDDLLKTAAVYRKKTFLRVDQDGNDIFDNIRAAMRAGRAQGQLIATGAMWQSNWFRKDGIIPEAPGQPLGGHAFALNGEEIIGGSPYLVALSSYGENDGKKGEYYFSREVVNREMRYGAYAVVDIPLEIVKKADKENSQIKLSSNTMPTETPVPVKAQLDSTTIQGLIKVVLGIIAHFVPTLIPNIDDAGETIFLIGALALEIWGTIQAYIGRLKAGEEPTKLGGVFRP